jgi:hypothetical protein
MAALEIYRKESKAGKVSAFDLVNMDYTLLEGKSIAPLLAVLAEESKYRVDASSKGHQQGGLGKKQNVVVEQ